MGRGDEERLPFFSHRLGLGFLPHKKVPTEIGRGRRSPPNQQSPGVVPSPSPHAVGHSSHPSSDLHIWSGKENEEEEGKAPFFSRDDRQMSSAKKEEEKIKWNRFCMKEDKLGHRRTLFLRFTILATFLKQKIASASSPHGKEERLFFHSLLCHSSTLPPLRQRGKRARSERFFLHILAINNLMYTRPGEHLGKTPVAARFPLFQAQRKTFNLASVSHALRHHRRDATAK